MYRKVGDVCWCKSPRECEKLVLETNKQKEFACVYVKMKKGKISTSAI